MQAEACTQLHCPPHRLKNAETGQETHSRVVREHKECFVLMLATTVFGPHTSKGLCATPLIALGEVDGKYDIARF